MSENKSRDSRVEILLFILGVAILTYVGGAYTAAFKTFPYPQLLEAPFQALEARMAKKAAVAGSKFKTSAWSRTDIEKTGLQLHKAGSTWGDYTLYTSAHDTAAYLIDMEDNLVHRWKLPFREVWPDPPHVSDPLPPNYIYWRRAHVFPNGDLLTIYVGSMDTPYGYGMVRLNADSEVIWKYAGNTHHDFHVQEDGSVYVLTHSMRDTDEQPVEGMERLPNPTMDDYIVHLSPEGEELERVSLLDALANSDFAAALQGYPIFIDEPFEKGWEPLHTNTVEVIDADFAGHHPFAEAGQVMVSIRGMDLVALVDMDSGQVVWGTRGVWWQQHDPDPLPNGNILVFDNNAYGGPGGTSRIVEYDPATGGVVWSYAGDEEWGFETKTHGSQQMLPNGNVLVSSSNQGWLFEVTRKGEIVWSFHNPFIVSYKDKKFAPKLCSGRRYTSEQLPFVEGAGE